MKAFVMQIRREFWEHRVLFNAPVALCVVFLLLCLLSGMGFGKAWVYVDGVGLGARPALPAHFTVYIHFAFTMLLYLLMAVVSFIYLAECLFAERKDRSILFWKSLPVSDTTTVLAKLLVALVVVPLLVYGLSLLTNLIAAVIFKVAFTFDRAPVDRADVWLRWLKLNGFLFADIFVLALWFAPVAAYQLLVSAWAPRAVMVWTVLPPIALVLGEKIFFNSWHSWAFLSDRLGGVMFRTDAPDAGIEGSMRGINAIPLLAHLDLWIGVVVAAALVYATVHIRRHRDDT